MKKLAVEYLRIKPPPRRDDEVRCPAYNKHWHWNIVYVSSLQLIIDELSFDDEISAVAYVITALQFHCILFNNNIICLIISIVINNSFFFQQYSTY